MAAFSFDAFLSIAFHVLSLKRAFYFVTVIAIILTVTVFLGNKPSYNWDLFPYMTLAISDSSVPFDSLHARVYLEAAAKMGSRDFNAVSQRQPHLMADPVAFQDILKYYQIKPGYIFAVRLLHLLGVNLVTATFLPSVISYFLLGCILFWWLQRIFPSLFASLATLVAMASSFLIESARYSSPDLMCALILFAGLFVLSEFSIRYGLAILGLSIFVRPDACILFLALILALYLCKQVSLRIALQFGIGGIAIMLLIVRSPEIIQEFLLPANPFSWSAGLWTGLNSLISSQTVIFTLLALVTLLLRRKPNSRFFDDLWSLFIMAALATFIIRYLLHPVVEDRFLIACYLLILIGFSKTLMEVCKPNST